MEKITQKVIIPVFGELKVSVETDVKTLIHKKDDNDCGYSYEYIGFDGEMSLTFIESSGQDGMTRYVAVKAIIDGGIEIIESGKIETDNYSDCVVRLIERVFKYKK